MRAPSPAPLSTSITRSPPRAAMFLSAEELAAAAGIARGRLARLVRLGLIEPAAPGARTFTADTVARLRRMLRLHADLGVGFTGAAIIVDLLERLERVEAELMRRSHIL